MKQPRPLFPTPLTKDQFEARYSVPDAPVVPASCVVDWLSEVEGESTLSWWTVTVQGARKPFKRKVYRIKALDDNMAAREGLRAFEREHAAGLI